MISLWVRTEQLSIYLHSYSSYKMYAKNVMVFFMQWGRVAQEVLWHTDLVNKEQFFSWKLGVIYT